MGATKCPEGRNGLNQFPQTAYPIATETFHGHSLMKIRVCPTGWALEAIVGIK